MSVDGVMYNDGSHEWSAHLNNCPLQREAVRRTVG